MKIDDAVKARIVEAVRRSLDDDPLRTVVACRTHTIDVSTGEWLKLAPTSWVRLTLEVDMDTAEATP